MLGVHPSLLIGSQLRALLSTGCVGSAFRGRLRVGNTVRRSKRCSARGRAAAVRDAVRLVNDGRFRRRGRVEACVEKGERWLGGAPRRQRQKLGSAIPRP